ncbi:hypothetical protein B0H17DRAFT_1065924 [Mycena rosella]|uniref:Uncharacterized protein n=1 Tax=Mycena rosella TaxID=1033263 RepID=A0AAD7GDW2_MYCRO|nr:hypothetical protein B0H17DRAFT_1065924 [Mycena rosella]
MPSPATTLTGMPPSISPMRTIGVCHIGNVTTNHANVHAYPAARPAHCHVSSRPAAPASHSTKSSTAIAET